MGKRIVGIIVLIAICVGIYYIYQHYKSGKQMANGDVTWISGRPSDDEKARFAREDSGDTPDGNSEHKTRSARQEAAMIQAESTPGAYQSSTGDGSSSTTASLPLTPTPQRPAVVPSASAAPMQQATMPAPMPAADSLTPNPPNGLAFRGTGAFELFRQGNITWRMDTATGRSCIIYATLEEWRKPIVYSHGCGRGA